MSEYGNLEAGQDSDYFMVHMMAMTTENLRGKGDIAGELAYRDQRIAEQAAEIAEIRETSKHINKIRMKEEAELSRLKADYSELLYQVQQKIPGETRHETAKRIIRQHEDHQGDNSQQAMEVDSNATE
jgi:hypothetical protein